MTLRLVTPPTQAEIDNFISLEEGKLQIDVDHADHDDQIERQIRTALAAVEAQVQRRYLTQTVDWVLQDWRDGVLKLPVAPVASVTSITYRDAGNLAQVMPATDYRVRPRGRATLITLSGTASWPILGDHAEPVIVRFVAGTAAASVPDIVKDAVLLKLRALYDRTEVDLADLLMAERWD